MQVQQLELFSSVVGFDVDPTVPRHPHLAAAALAGAVRSIAKPDDFVVCLGAGNITQWAYALPGELQAGK